MYNFASAVFFSKFEILLYKTGYTFMIQSIVHRWPLFSPIFRVAYESRVEKTGHLLRLSNRSNFLLLHKTGSAGQPGRVPLIGTSDSQREQRLENTAGGGTSHFNVSKYVLTTFATWGRALSCCKITLSCLSLYCMRPFVFQCSNASIAFDTDRL